MTRIAKSLDTLRAQVNAKWPNRDKSNDGWIGDARHQASKSDHNPNRAGVVQAFDISNDPARGPKSDALAHAIVESRDSRIKYVISNRKICAPYATGGQPAWTWRPYTGPNAHDRHCHISVRDEPKLYDDPRIWVVPMLAPAKASEPAPQVASGNPVLPFMDWLLEDEGVGIEIRAGEPGGAVNMGVSFLDFSSWWKDQKKPGEPTFADLAKLKRSEAAEIFNAYYYSAVARPEWSVAQNYAVFDSAINDGVVGSKGLVALTKSSDPAAFVHEFTLHRLERKKKSPSWEKYGRGWSARIQRVCNRALGLLEKEKK